MGETTGPRPDDPKVQTVEPAGQANRGRGPTRVRYGTGLFWVSAIGLLGLGAAIAWATPVVGAFFLLFGGLALAALVPAKRIGDRALVIDDEGIAHTGLWGTQYRVPWGEITGPRRDGGGLELREPLSRYRVPPPNPRRDRGRSSLLLPSTLAISNEDLVELIGPHLPDAENDGRERTSP